MRDLLGSLRGAETVQPQWAVVDQWAADGAVDRLADAALALASPTPEGVPEWAARSVSDRIAELLALTAGAQFARAARRVARVADARLLASLTAAGQSLDVCVELIEEADRGDEEFLACLTQELVLRLEHLDREPFMHFWQRVQSSGHELGWLELHLTPIEASIGLPSHSLGGMTYSPPGAASDASGDDTAARIGAVTGEMTDANISERLSSAVTTWLELSNGRAEARVFALAGGRQHRPLAEALAGTGLESVGDTGGLRVRAVTVEDAFASVFAAASTGGAYNHGYRGAYGRLRAWQSVGALVGADVDDPLEAAAELAQRSRWFSFTSDWFDDVAWDIGLVVINTDHTRLAVLAATDTD